VDPCVNGISCLLSDLELHSALCLLLHYDCPRGNALAARDVALDRTAGDVVTYPDDDIKIDKMPNDGGRGVYFPDPDGHYLEVMGWIGPSAAAKSRDTPLSSSTASKGPNRIGAGSPSISARKRADFARSDE
jgi:hypothetical protein